MDDTKIITRKDLAKHFARLGFNLGVEVGVAGGGYSVILCQANPNLKLYAVDTWGKYDTIRKDYHERKYKEAKSRLADYNVTLVRKHSLEATEDFDNNSLDFVYIDASHRFNNVIKDIIAWKPKVRKGGIVAGDDYNTSPGVKLAVDAFTTAHRQKLKLTTKPDYRGTVSWWFVKRWNS